MKHGAIAFARAGFAAIVFDHRNVGASDGAPRGEIDPLRQVRDYRAALSLAATLPEVDANRLGVWGTSYSGGRANSVAALDRPVPCLVAQAPLISGWCTVQRPVLLPGGRVDADGADFARASQAACG